MAKENPYRVTNDHLGFILESADSSLLYEESQSNYLKTLARRSSRWDQFMRLKQYKYNKSKLQRFVRKGIPSNLRPKIWMTVSGAQKLMQDNKGVYDGLKNSQPPPDVVESIDIDLPRTFPNNVYFKDDSSDNSLRPMLRNVLIAFAVKEPNIGYCQGLNYVASVLLLVMRDEQKAFWILVAIVTKLVPGYYDQDPIAMLGLQTDLRVLSSLVKEKVPEVATMMDLHKVDWSFVCTKWFICLYADVLPTETLLRIWDAFFNEGRQVLFRVALLLMINGKVTLLSSTAMHHIMKSFQALTTESYTWQCHKFMQMAFADNLNVSTKHLEELTTECKTQVLKELHSSQHQ